MKDKLFPAATAMGIALLAACSQTTAVKETKPAKVAVARDTCGGAYPSYWQDPAFTSVGMWEGQKISNQPPAGYTGPVFKLSQKFPADLIDDKDDWGWTAFNPFKDGLSPEDRTKQSEGYTWAVMKYLQAGNIDHGDIEKDWNPCTNEVRNWYHMPFQTYDPLSGREFIHGLTREAPVKFTLAGGKQIATTVWAVGFYNARGAQTLGSVWRPDGKPLVPASAIAFPEGAVVGKLLFTTATAAELPNLKGLPAWKLNMSDAAFCACKPSPGEKTCTFAQMSEQCPRQPGEVRLMQFDIAVRDSRAPLGWAFGTFVADGEARGGEQNPWNRISPLGLMWGNDPPPAGQSAATNPADPRKNGFKSETIFWDVADRLNNGSNSGHLGCDSRLNGPADNIASSCMSCHMTASVPDKNLVTPPIIAQFGGIKPQCVTPPKPANLDVDAIYFADTMCGRTFDGGKVVPPPAYASGEKNWIALDFSLQLSISLTQWGNWVEHQAPPASGALESVAPAKPAARRLKSLLPAR